MVLRIIVSMALLASVTRIHGFQHYHRPLLSIRHIQRHSVGMDMIGIGRRKKVSATEVTTTPFVSPFKIYFDYLKKLWDDTSMDARRKVAEDVARSAVKKARGVVSIEALEQSAQNRFLKSCDRILSVMDAAEATHQMNHAVDITVTKVDEPLRSQPPPLQGHENEPGNASGNSSLTLKGQADPVKKKKKSRSILFGVAMGAVVACWVFSGNYIFTGLFTLMTVLGQLEYYRMVMNTGIYPARRISVVGACATFITALFAPDLHQIVLPVFATIAMIWFISKPRSSRPGSSSLPTIAEIATTYTGMFYLGYIPSFWVRIRLVGSSMVDPTRMQPLVEPLFQQFQQISTPQTRALVTSPVTTGAKFLFWSWLCIAFSDVGAYFVGRNYGKTPLGAGAGAASPNKTREGVVGGCIVSGLLMALGAWVQKWPLWYLTGPLHGTILALLGLVGDLTASIFKRDAGLKDFGDLLPEHGGILDRVDSFIFTAPYSWVFITYFLPWLKATFS